MPRIAEARPPAEPSSPVQKERYRRILEAAARHGADKGLERMQMHDVAKDAGVAIATLYRYFPSKTHLFTALMGARVQELSDVVADSPAVADPVEAVSELLVGAGRQLLARPLLAHAMMQSNNASVATSDSAVTKVFADLMLQVLQLEHPDEEQERLVRITEAAWYGIIMSALNHHITAEQAAEDTRVACHRLLADI